MRLPQLVRGFVVGYIGDKTKETRINLRGF
jgi:hypothetical protein